MPTQSIELDVTWVRQCYTELPHADAQLRQKRARVRAKPRAASQASQCEEASSRLRFLAVAKHFQPNHLVHRPVTFYTFSVASPHPGIPLSLHPAWHFRRRCPSNYTLLDTLSTFTIQADEPPLSRFKGRLRSSDRGPDTRSASPNPYNAAPGTIAAGASSRHVKPSPLGAVAHDNGILKDIESGQSINVPDSRYLPQPPPAPPPSDPPNEIKEAAPLDTVKKPPWPQRIKAGSVRFVLHFKDALFHSWINVLLVFVPIGIAMEYAPLPHSSKPTIVFSMNAVAIIPLAGLLAHATECVASAMGDTWASLLNVTFGNAVELIIFIIALAKDQISTVQAAIMGSILANLLLILGMAFLFGGLRYQEQFYNSTVTQMSACLLSLSVVSLLLPTAFQWSFSNQTEGDVATVKISRGTSVILLIIYVLYLLFQLKSHAYMYASTPQEILDEESRPGVLADMLSSSSSDSSSSSSDSDSSLGSHATAGKRLKRAVKKRIRRKSSASSVTTASPPSANMSIQGEKKSLQEDLASSPSQEGSYFDLPRQDTQASAGAVFSGDEADTDGENDRGAMDPHVRDFELENAGSSRHSPRSQRKQKPKKSKKKHRKASKDEVPIEKGTDRNQNGFNQAPNQPPQQPRVGFKDEPEPGENLTATASRRGFTRQMSRARFGPPPLTNLLSNNVFNNPPPATRTPGGSRPVPFSIAHRTTGTLRRTSSLPDRLNRPAATRMASQSGQRGRSDLTNNDSGTHPSALVSSAPDAGLKDRTEDKKEPELSRTAAVILLLCTTGLVAFCAELGVDAIPEMVSDTSVSLAFIGLIVLPIVGNAAEHVTAVTVAAKNKMDLAIGVAVGSSIQIALFVTPVVVLLGWIMGKDMTLYFNLFETISLFVTAFVINFLILDGRSNYLEGSLLIAAYVIIAVAAFFYPNARDASLIGGGDDQGQLERRLF
ncbi:MAG: hypothetical protein Q9159_005654 [Coniocarpon cinnabarinum]